MALRLTTQASLLAASRAAGQVLNALIGIVLARALSQEDFGTFRQIYLLFGTLILITDIGLTESLYYFIPRAPEKRVLYLRQTILVVAALQVVAGLALVFSHAAIGKFFNNPALAGHIALLAIYMGFTVLTRLWEVQLVSEQRVPLAAAVTGGFEAGKVALMFVALAVAPGVRPLLWALVIGAGIKGAAYLWFLARDLRGFPAAGPAAFRGPDAAEQFSYALALWVPGMLGVAATYAHQYIVGYRFTPAEYAVYSVACFQVPFVGVLTTSIIEVMLVRVTQARAEQRFDEVSRVWNFATLKALQIFLPLAVGLAVLSRPLIVLLFSARYAAAAPLFAVLMAGLPLNALFTDNMLRAYGAMRSYGMFYAARLALGLALGILGVIWLGLWGAAISTGLTFVAIKGWQLTKVAELLHVRPAQVLPWKSIGRITLASAVAALPALLCALLWDRPIWALLTGLPLYGLTYVYVSFNLGLLSAEDLDPFVAARPLAPAFGMRRPRVMLFTDSFIHGGTERQFVEVLRRLAREKYDVVAACLQRRGPFLADVEALGIPVIEFPIHTFRNPKTLFSFLRLVAFLQRNRIDVVHAFDFYTDVFAVPAARLAGVPVVLASRRELAGDRTPWQQRAIRMASQLAHAIVANSQAAGSRLTGYFGNASQKVAVIPNCLDLASFHPARSREDVRRELGLSRSTPLAGILAALRPEKDVAAFLHAAARAASAVPDARFVVIGDGSERTRLEALADLLGIASRVNFLGDRHDVADLLAALDVFVLSSITESFPNAVLEAMAVARPVVATRVGGVPELVEDGSTGFLVPVGDAQQMGARIAELLRDPELGRKLGEAGRARVEREFTPAAMQARLESLYDRLLRLRRPTARILQIGNYPPPVCGWSLHTQIVQRELAACGADSRVMDIGPGRRIPGRGCIPVQNVLDYAAKLVAFRLRGFTFQAHVNGDSWKGYSLALAAVLLGRLTAKPSVLTFHAGPQQIYFPRARGFWHWAFRLLFRASGEVICNHEPVKRLILGYGVAEDKVHPIPAYSSQYNEELPVPLPADVERFLDTHEPRMLSYAMFRPEFTMEALFVAFAAVCRSHPRAGLLIAGPKEVPEEALARLRALGIEHDVHLPGNLPHAEFLTAVQRSDVFVRTHLRDGVCTSVLEALQLGVPVVAAEDGLRPPSVVTYSPGDAAALADALCRVLADLDRARAQVRPPEVRDNLQAEIALLLAAGDTRAFAVGGGESRG